MKHGEQDASSFKEPRAFLRMLHVFVLLVILLIVFALQMLQNHKDKFARTFDDDVRDFWIDHVENFPVHPKDRYAFHEMGFRTAKYAEALRLIEPIQIDQTARLETALWGFMAPALEQSPLSAQVRSNERLKATKRYRHLITKSNMIQKVKGSWPIKSRKGRGIVTIAERENLRATIELVTILRYSLKDDIPIEIFYYGTNDLPELRNEALIMMPAIRTIDLSTISLFGEMGFDGLNLATMTTKRSTALQAMAILLSEFDEVIYAAPGTIFLQKPEEMLKDNGYRSTGTLFFHGLNTAQLADSNRFLNFLRQQFDQGQPTAELAVSPFYNFGINTQQDSRVLAVDKSRPGVFASLLLNVWLHTPPVRSSIWEAHFPECLTESIWLSFELSKTPYYFEQAYPGAIGNFDGSIEELPWEPTICPAHALHFVGRSSYASRRGEPMWADGGLKVFPHHVDFLKVNAWSARGRWEQTKLGMCLVGADAQAADRHSLAKLYYKHRIIDETFEDIFSPIFDIHNISTL